MQRLGLLSKAGALAALLAVVGAAPGSGPNPYARILLLESRRSLGAGELGAWLNSADERVAVRAALAIGRTKRPAGEPLLAAHLSDPRAPVRAMSLYALGLLATGREAAALTAALHDPSGAVRVAALDAIARYEAAGAFAAQAQRRAQAGVEVSLASDADPIVRARAAIALVEFRDSAGAYEAADSLATAFRTDSSLEVRRHAMWTIFRGYALKAGRRTIETALADRDEIVRIEAVRAMSRLRDPALVALVKPLLGDPSWRVAEQAGETIRILEGKPMTDHLTRIPAYVHLPPKAADPLAALPALARTPVEGAPAAPAVQRALLEPKLLPSSARAMTGPAPGEHPRVRILTTKGAIYLVLYPEWAPLTVANFLDLANRGYYDGNRWFRIVPDFVVQTGDPHDNGDGDAGYSIGAEENPLEQDSYVMSMGLNYDEKTNTPIRDSAGTQYYITLSPQYHLDRDFTVFAKVTGGFDVLARLVESDRVLRVERIADQNLR